MTSLLALPVAVIVRRYASGLAVVHRDLLDGLDKAEAALDRVNGADAGDHPGYVLSPVFRRHVGPLLQASLAETDLRLRVVQFDGLRLRFLVDGRLAAEAPIRKRKRQYVAIEEDGWPLRCVPELRPGRLTLLWDFGDDQPRSLVLARVDPDTWDDVLAIYEEAPLPPPAAEVYQAPPGSSNDADDLRGVVKPKKGHKGREDIDSA